MSYEDQQTRLKDASPIFSRMCEINSFNKSDVLPVTGFRLVSAKSISVLPARGFSSAIDFYAAVDSRAIKVSTLVEAIQTEIQLEKLPVFFEHQDKSGQWQRSYFNTTSETLVTTPVSVLSASHGIVIEQFPTAAEKYAIFGVSLTVVDLTSNKVVAQNIGFRADQDFDAHNRPRLTEGRHCGWPQKDNYVGTWLTSLVRKQIPGSVNPYDKFKKHEEIQDEMSYWTNRRSCVLPLPGREGSSNATGSISVVRDGVIGVEHPVRPGDNANRMVTNVKVTRDTFIYTYYGFPIGIDDLKVGQPVRITFVDCRHILGQDATAEFIAIDRFEFEGEFPKLRTPRPGRLRTWLEQELVKAKRIIANQRQRPEQ